MSVFLKAVPGALLAAVLHGTAILAPTTGSFTIGPGFPAGNLNLDIAGSGFTLTGQGTTSTGPCRAVSSDVIFPRTFCVPGTTSSALGDFGSITTEDLPIGCH